MTLDHEATLLCGIAFALSFPKYSDLTIKCQGRQWHVHKLIVCMASRTLEAAIAHGTEEAMTSTIVHEEYDADTMNILLSYIYKGDYEVGAPDFSDATEYEELERADDDNTDSTANPGTTSINDHLIAHARVFGLADYYDIPLLRTLATQKFVDLSNREWQLEGFTNVVREVHKCSPPTDRQLCVALRDAVCMHKSALSSNDDFMRDLAELDDVQEFAADMYKDMVQRADVQHEHNQKLEHQLVEMRTNSAECKRRMQEEIASLKSRLENLRLEGEGEVARTKAAGDDLMIASTYLPKSCPNLTCLKLFKGPLLDDVSIERKGRVGEPVKWWISCKACNRKLN